MIRSLFHPRRTLVLLALAVLILACMPAETTQYLTGTPNRFVRMVLAPLSDGIRAAALWLRPQAPDSRPMIESALLLAERDQAVRLYRQKEDELREAEERIEQLGRVRERVGTSSISLVDARVNGWLSGPSASVLRISRGTRDGVGPNMVVASGVNLVGRVGEQPGVLNADVRLITSPGTHLAVRIVPASLGEMTREALATLEVSPNQLEFTCVVPATNDVREGDLAYLSDSTWPPEAGALVVGRVVEVVREPTDPLLRHRVTVRPVLELNKLSRVIVVVSQVQER